MQKAVTLPQLKIDPAALLTNLQQSRESLQIALEPISPKVQPVIQQSCDFFILARIDAILHKNLITEAKQLY